MALLKKIAGDCCRLCTHWHEKKMKCRLTGDKAGPFYVCNRYEKKQEQLALFHNAGEENKC